MAPTVSFQLTDGSRDTSDGRRFWTWKRPQAVLVFFKMTTLSLPSCPGFWCNVSPKLMVPSSYWDTQGLPSCSFDFMGHPLVASCLLLIVFFFFFLCFHLHLDSCRDPKGSFSTGGGGRAMLAGLSCDWLWCVAVVWRKASWSFLLLFF